MARRAECVMLNDGPYLPEALDFLADTHIDVLFTDIELPGGMNGTELADAAQKLDPNIKVLFTTGYAREAVLHDRWLQDKVPWLLKPYSHRELARELKALLVEGAQSGVLELEERDMIERVLRLADKPVRAIMTPRTELAWIDRTDPPKDIATALRAAPSSPLSALPQTSRRTEGGARWVMRSPPTLRPPRS